MRRHTRADNKLRSLLSECYPATLEAAANRSGTLAVPFPNSSHSRCRAYDLPKPASLLRCAGPDAPAGSTRSPTNSLRSPVTPHVSGPARRADAGHPDTAAACHANRRSTSASSTCRRPSRRIPATPTTKTSSASLASWSGRRSRSARRRGQTSVATRPTHGYSGGSVTTTPVSPACDR
jgi:hypothetical protein